MSTLKELLRTETLVIGAKASVPSGEYVDIPCKSEVDSWADIANFTAPTDGCIIARGRSKTSEGGLTISAESGYVGQAWSTTGWDLGVPLTVRKGMAVSIKGGNLNMITLKIYKLVGGGVKHLINHILTSMEVCYGN